MGSILRTLGGTGVLRVRSPNYDALIEVAPMRPAKSPVRRVSMDSSQPAPLPRRVSWPIRCREEARGRSPFAVRRRSPGEAGAMIGRRASRRGPAELHAGTRKPSR